MADRACQQTERHRLQFPFAFGLGFFCFVFLSRRQSRHRARDRCIDTGEPGRAIDMRPKACGLFLTYENGERIAERFRLSRPKRLL